MLYLAYNQIDQPDPASNDKQAISNQNIQQSQQQTWATSGDPVESVQPLQRGRQYPELIDTPLFQQAAQPNDQQPDVVGSTNLQYGQHRQQTAQTLNLNPQSQGPMQRLGPNQGPKPNAGDVQNNFQPNAGQSQPKTRPKVQKPPQYDYESLSTPARRPGPQAGQGVSGRKQVQQLKPSLPQQQSNIQPSSDRQSGAKSQINPPQQVNAAAQNIQTNSAQQGGNGGQVPNNGQLNGIPIRDQVSQQSNVANINSGAMGNSQIGPQQITPGANQQPPAQQHQPKGYYTDGGFILANPNNNIAPSNQRGQQVKYKNAFNKYQYQAPFYGQKLGNPHYENNYDYTNYVYGDQQPSNYNYDYNQGIYMCPCC